MKIILPVLASFVLGAGLGAQTQAFAMPGERATTMMAAFDMATFTSPGWMVVNYGQPTWKPEYEAMADQIKGKAARLGRDFWTTLETCVDVTIGTTKVPAGYYYCAIQCSEKSEWSLLLLDSAEARKQKLLPNMTGKIVESGSVKTIAVPMTHAKSEKSVEKMTMTLTSDEKKLGTGSFTIAWGPHQVSAPVACEIPAPAKDAKAKDAGADKKDAAPTKK